jgi:hypothetical protein
VTGWQGILLCELSRTWNFLPQLPLDSSLSSPLVFSCLC